MHFVIQHLISHIQASLINSANSSDNCPVVSLPYVVAYSLWPTILHQSPVLKPLLKCLTLLLLLIQQRYFAASISAYQSKLRF